MDSLRLLKEGLVSLNIDFDDSKINLLDEFRSILIEWNEKINLTAITDTTEVYIKHFIDSATCLATGYILNSAKVIDVGTGAGFPGIPVKIFRDDISMTLLDSLNKRVMYLNNVIERLGLSKIEAVHARAEDAGINKIYREKYDIALSRAVAPMNILCEYCLPFVKKDGYFICQKGPNYEDELNASKNAIKLLGGKIIDVKEYMLPFSDIIHYVIIVQKMEETPSKYPRKAGKPSSSPIL